MPYFTVIAGPNGAGKSSFSKVLSPEDCVIFDPDSVKAEKEKQFPDLPIDSIDSLITAAYWEIEKAAIDNEQNLTIETNLRNDFLIERLSYVKNKGFITNLIFMLLPDLQTSIDRVNLRVKRKGHFVDLESIKYNFEQSLLKLKQHFIKFDNIWLLNCSTDKVLSSPVPVLIVKSHQISFIDTNAPLWAKSIIDEIVQHLTDTIL